MCDKKYVYEILWFGLVFMVDLKNRGSHRKQIKNQIDSKTKLVSTVITSIYFFTLLPEYTYFCIKIWWNSKRMVKKMDTHVIFFFSDKHFTTHYINVHYRFVFREKQIYIF